MHTQTNPKTYKNPWFNAQVCFHGNTIIVYLKNCGIFTIFVSRRRIQSMFTKTLTNYVQWKDTIINVIQINVKYALQKKIIKHTSFLKTYCILLVAKIVNSLTIFSCLATIIEALPG